MLILVAQLIIFSVFILEVQDFYYNLTKHTENSG